MKELGLQSFVRVRRYRSYKGNYGKVAPNILKRDFRADKLNLKWVTDVTQFNVLDTKIYLSPIVDLFNGEVISYNISESPNFHQIEDMLDKSIYKDFRQYEFDSSFRSRLAISNGEISKSSSRKKESYKACLEKEIA